MSTPIGSTPYARRRKRPRWLTFALLGLILVPVIEIAVLIAVGKTIGLGWTILALLLLTVLGTWLMRREGARTWKALRAASQTGTMPSREIADGALVLIGGAFLLLPGFVSDVIGLFFVLPFTRVFARRVLEAFVESRMLVRMPFPSGSGGQPGPSGPGGPSSPGAQGTIRGEVID